eukprot:Tamp_19555.p1 GENE.Tamp_19555~~Tamp_19555.p1  ORF type:complete len:221 (+),score=78.01 Tamp_19555:42-665(+)
MAVAACDAFSPAPSLGLRQASLSSGLSPARAPALPQLRMQGGAWGGEPEKAKASLELLQIRFAKVDVDNMKAWIQKWPKGTKKDGFGMPKLMLPVETTPMGNGVKISWKGSDDPWMQLDLEGDTVRVFRQSMLMGSFGQISALKEREEKKICDKLKEDLAQSAFASGMNERELPKIEKPKAEEKEEEKAEDAEKKEGEEAPSAEKSD